MSVAVLTGRFGWWRWAQLVLQYSTVFWPPLAEEFNVVRSGQPLQPHSISWPNTCLFLC